MKTETKMNRMPSPLPSVAQYSSADIVLYDGNCVFCTQSVRRLMRLDGKHRLAYLSIHDPVVAKQFPDLSMDMLMEQMYVIPKSHPQLRFGGAAAVRYLSRRLPKLWIIAPLMHIPFSLPIWQFLYRQIAKRRYRIAKREMDCDESGSCELHDRG